MLVLGARPKDWALTFCVVIWSGVAIGPIERGWLWLHESGTYANITPEGAKLFV